jgi:hypothetical protein
MRSLEGQHEAVASDRARLPHRQTKAGISAKNPRAETVGNDNGHR